MILALDVHYKSTYAKTVGVLYNWRDEAPTKMIITRKEDVSEYVPGEFYKRELPCLLQAIDQIDLIGIETIVVDGHVFLDNNGKHGLGGYLYEALERRVPVVGVAKRAFHANEQYTISLLRGESKNPLYVSAIGMEKEVAANHILSMHGNFRIPTILQVLDTETKKGM